MKRFNRKASSDETAVSELIVLCEGLKRNISKYGDEVYYLDDVVASSSADKPVILDKSDRDSIDGLEIHKSSIINFIFRVICIF
jgi:hypothetical protein